MWHRPGQISLFSIIHISPSCCSFNQSGTMLLSDSTSLFPRLAYHLECSLLSRRTRTSIKSASGKTIALLYSELSGVPSRRGIDAIQHNTPARAIFFDILGTCLNWHQPVVKALSASTPKMCALICSSVASNSLQSHRRTTFFGRGF